MKETLKVVGDLFGHYDVLVTLKSGDHHLVRLIPHLVDVPEGIDSRHLSMIAQSAGMYSLKGLNHDDVRSVEFLPQTRLRAELDRFEHAIRWTDEGDSAIMASFDRTEVDATKPLQLPLLRDFDITAVVVDAVVTERSEGPHRARTLFLTLTEEQRALPQDELLQFIERNVRMELSTIHLLNYHDGDQVPRFNDRYWDRSFGVIDTDAGVVFDYIPV